MSFHCETVPESAVSILGRAFERATYKTYGMLRETAPFRCCNSLPTGRFIGRYQNKIGGIYCNAEGYSKFHHEIEELCYF